VSGFSLYNLCDSCRDDRNNSCDTQRTLSHDSGSHSCSCNRSPRHVLWKHNVRGLTKPGPQASYVFLLGRSYVSTRHVDASHFYVSLIYGEYLANVHFGDIPHNFIPHSTRHSTKKSALNFLEINRSQLSAFRVPQRLVLKRDRRSHFSNIMHVLQ